MMVIGLVCFCISTNGESNMKIASNCATSTRSGIASKSFLTLTLAVAGVIFGAGPAWSAPILGSDLASFAVLGAAGVTNVPTSTIGGNVGSAPNATVGGGYVFSSGSLQANTALAQNAQIQLDAAILAVNASGPGTLITGGDLDAWQISHGGFIIPGTYTVPFATTNLVGDLFLDGGGSNSAGRRVLRAGDLVMVVNEDRIDPKEVGGGTGGALVAHILQTLAVCDGRPLVYAMIALQCAWLGCM